jgi:hypothetical protein
MTRSIAEQSSFITILALVILLLWLPPLHAQPQTGDHEIEAAGGLFHQQGADTGALNLDLSYGYYLTPGWELGLRQSLNYNFIDDGSDVWTATTTPFLNYNFRLTPRILPFLGGFIGVVWNDRDVTGTVGPNAGVKIFLADQVYFTARYRYEIFFNKIEAIGDNESDGNHVVNFGLGFVWGGARKP